MSGTVYSKLSSKAQERLARHNEQVRYGWRCHKCASMRPSFSATFYGGNPIAGKEARCPNCGALWRFPIVAV